MIERCNCGRPLDRDSYAVCSVCSVCSVCRDALFDRIEAELATRDDRKPNVEGGHTGGRQVPERPFLAVPPTAYVRSGTFARAPRTSRGSGCYAIDAPPPACRSSLSRPANETTRATRSTAALSMLSKRKNGGVIELPTSTASSTPRSRRCTDG